MSDKKDFNDLSEVRNNVRDLFNYEKTPVIEDHVDRGDKSPASYRVFQGDITLNDVLKLAKFAVDKYVDNVLVKDNLDKAVNEAVTLSIGAFEDGKWQSKINHEMFDLICSKAKEMLTAKKVKDIMKDKPENNDLMKSASENTEVVESSEKGTITQLGVGGRTNDLPKGQVMKTLKEKAPQGAYGKLKKMITKGTPVVILASVIDSLDKAATQLEASGNLALASELDRVANTLENSDKEEE